jgi:Tol biopolymer transport system component
MLLAISLATALAAPSNPPAPRPFQPQMLGSTALSPAFSPDGETMLFTRQTSHQSIIMESHRLGAKWSEPRAVSFSGRRADMDPAFGPDGSYVVFVSTRPAPGASGKTMNLWLVKRVGVSWGTPVHLPPSVNVSPFIYAPSIARDGTIYFMRSSETREHQLERARYRNGTYLHAERLTFSSAATKDADPLVAPNQSYVLFVSAGRNGAKDTNQHIYVARAQGASWGSVQPVRYQGEYSGDSDCCLSFGPGSNALLFTGGRGNESQVYALPIP